MIYSIDALRTLAASVGFPDPNLAAAIAMAESGGDACARGDPRTLPFDCTSFGPATSFGLFQIHVPDHPEVDASRLFDAMYNAQAALAISAGGTNFSPWSTFTGGQYRQFLPPPAAATSPAGVNVGGIVLGAAIGTATAFAIDRVLEWLRPHPGRGAT